MTYTDTMTAKYDDNTQSWNAEYYVNNSKMETGQKFEISFTIDSGADIFKQMVVQNYRNQLPNPELRIKRRTINES